MAGFGCRPREEAREILENIYPAIFENELHGWDTDEADWPQGRDFAMFKAWFEIELHSVVEDLCDYWRRSKRGCC